MVVYKNWKWYRPIMHNIDLKKHMYLCMTSLISAWFTFINKDDANSYMQALTTMLVDDQLSIGKKLDQLLICFDRNYGEGYQLYNCVKLNSFRYLNFLLIRFRKVKYIFSLKIWLWYSRNKNFLLWYCCVFIIVFSFLGWSHQDYCYMTVASLVTFSVWSIENTAKHGKWCVILWCCPHSGRISLQHLRDTRTWRTRYSLVS